MLLDRRDLGTAIKHLRVPRTQAEVAKQGGLPSAQWSVYEKGKRWPGDKKLAQIIRGLGCTPEILLDEILKARAHRLGRESSTVVPEGRRGRSDLQRILTELRSIHHNMHIFATYIVGLERRIEQLLAVAPSPDAEPSRSS
jgi:transcriptional regulator with XRE-family HTH domain